MPGAYVCGAAACMRIPWWGWGGLVSVLTAGSMGDTLRIAPSFVNFVVL